MSICSDELADRLQRCYTGAVYDVLREFGFPDQVLPDTLRPLDLGSVMAGKIFTVEGRVENGVDAHESLLKWTSLLSKAPPGCVVVCQPHDSTMAHFGELSCETFLLRGMRGYVVDGGCRDTSFIVRRGFPVWFRYATPRDIVGRWLATGFGSPISIGGVKIRTGDYLLADRDGVVIIPSEIAATVTERVEEVLRTENKVRAAILDGVDPQEAYLRFRKF